jgi:long-subunit fatty acid transport protein
VRRLATLALLLALASGAWASDGAAPTIVGTKGPVSLPMNGDGQSAFRMPSSIAWAETSRVDLDTFAFAPIVTVRNATNDFRQESLGAGGTGGIVLSLPGPGWLDPDLEDEPVPCRRLQLHVGEYVEMGGAGGTSKMYSVTYPQGRNTETALSMLTTAFTVAYAPTEWLGLGASFHFIYGQLAAKSLIGGGQATLNGSPKINGVSLPGNPTYTDFIKLFQTSSAGDPATYVATDNMTSLQVSGALAATLRPMPNLGFGLSYSPASTVLQDFQGKALVDGQETVALAINPLDPAVRNVFLSTLPDGGKNGYLASYKIKVSGIHTPDTVRASAAFVPIDRLLLGAEVDWYGWFRALQPVATLSSGNNRDLNYMIGSQSVTTPITTRWSNQFVYSLYAAFGVTEDLTLRMGINYGAIPANTLYLGNGPNAALVSTNFSVGAGYRIGDFEIMTLFETSFYDHVQSDGRASTVSTKYASYSARQFLLHAGVGYEF